MMTMIKHEGPAKRGNHNKHTYVYRFMSKVRKWARLSLSLPGREIGGEGVEPSREKSKEERRCQLGTK